MSNRQERSLYILSSFILAIMSIFFSPNFLRAAYPEKPMTLVCVYPAGGANDVIARHIANIMKKYFPEPVVVMNQAGAVGTVGTAMVASAKPDGYTIGLNTMSPVTIMPHLTKLPYDTPDDYTPIALVGAQQDFLVVHSDLPFNTLKDFIDYAKTNPGKLRLATGGVGHFTQLIVEQLKHQAQIDIVDVPTLAGASQIAVVLGKHVEGTLITPYETMANVEAGKLKALAVADEKRHPKLPRIPTFRELGYDITITTYTLLIGPKGLPSNIVSKIQEAYKKVSGDPEFIKAMDSQGFTIVYEGADELKERLWKDYKLNKGIFERLGTEKK